MGCFAATWAQGTVPYFSLDAPRNVTLAYHGDRVAPHPIVGVDVWPDPTFGAWPSEYQLQVKVNGSFVTFDNGETMLRFQGTSGTTHYRIAGQFNASGHATGTVLPMEIVVSAKIGATLFTNRIVTRFLSVNETASPIARGWTLAGIPRLYPQADGSKLVIEGDGSATWFWLAGGVLQAPVGDFSTLTAVGGNWVRAWPDSTKVTFNNAGLMTVVTDRWGVSTTVIHDTNNRVTQIRDPLDNAISLAYNANGLATITDPFGRVTTVTVTANRTLTAIQDPDGGATSFGYDGSLRLATITNRLGATTTLSHGAGGKIVSSTAPAVPVFQSGTVSPVTQFQPWQTIGLPTGSTAVTPAAPVPVNQVEARITEPGGAVTRFTVNRWGAPAVTTNALGEVTTISYNAAGQPVRVVAPGYGTAFDTTAYNGSGLVTFSRAAAGTPTTILYGGWAQPVSVFGPGQDSLTLALGANGRVASVKVGFQLWQSFTYDSFGRVLTVTDGVGVTAVTNTYPATGTHRNLIQTTAPGNRVTTLGHDTFGRRTTVSAPTLPLQTTFYSVINRVDSVVVATSPATVTRIGYNALFPICTTDPKGQAYQTAYNALGWVTSETDPAGGVTSHAYSMDGDLRQTTTRRGQTVTVGYDLLHRPLTQTGSNTRSFSYANNGFVVTGTSAASTQTSFLNLRGQADSVRTVLQGQTFVQRFGYTAAGLLDTVTVTGPGGMAFQGRKYLYDEARGLLTGIRLGGALTQFATDGNANPTAITFPAGDTQQILRGVIQAPIRITTTAPYPFFQFDPLGRLIEGKDMQRPPSGGQTGCPEDPNAILCADGSVPSEPGAGYSVVGTPAVYSFDAVGNRLDQGGGYTPGNRITQFNGCGYTTDLDGNVTSRSGGGCGAGAEFFWSAEGELDSLHTGTTGVRYLYDAGGRLVVKRVNGVVQAVFLWQGDNLMAELDGTATVKRAVGAWRATPSYPGSTICTRW